MDKGSMLMIGYSLDQSPKYISLRTNIIPILYFDDKL